MASLALMLVSIWLISEGKSAAWAFYPMIFMFVTTIAALIYTSYNLLSKVFTGKVQGEALIGNTLMGAWGSFLSSRPSSWPSRVSRRSTATAD